MSTKSVSQIKIRSDCLIKQSGEFSASLEVVERGLNIVRLRWLVGWVTLDMHTEEHRSLTLTCLANYPVKYLKFTFIVRRRIEAKITHKQTNYPFTSQTHSLNVQSSSQSSHSLVKHTNYNTVTKPCANISPISEILAMLIGHLFSDY